VRDMKMDANSFVRRGDAAPNMSRTHPLHETGAPGLARDQ
jgi:hypothetical protein